MRMWQSISMMAAGLMALSGLIQPAAAAQDYDTNPLEARVWLDRGSEPVLERGDRARIYYRVSESAFVSIFHIDSNGNVRMVFPSSPQENHYARGGRDYRVLFPGSSYWYVGDDPGIGYFFIVASPEPFDFQQFGYSHFAGGWDLSRIGMQVYGDPYLAMDDYVGALVPDWEYIGYGLDFTSYHVDTRHDYPRFLCYDCHGYQPYGSWNPYAYSCTSFRVVIYNDPYYYPATRYRGTRVVYVQPRRGVAHFGFKERGAGEAGVPQIVTRNTPPATRPGVESNGNRRAVPRAGTPSAFNPNTNQGRAPGATGTVRPGVEGTATRRTGAPSSAVGGSTRQSGSVRPGATSPGSRSPSATTRPPTTRPSVKVRKPGGVTGGSTSGGTATRGTTRSSPTVRSSGSTTRRTPTVRRPGGTATKTPPRTTRAPTRTKVKVTKPRGGTGRGQS
jgi:hypothetical protein